MPNAHPTHLVLSPKDVNTNFVFLRPLGLRLRHSGTLNESTNVGVKTGGSRVGGPELCVKADGNRRQGTRCFTQARALSMEVKPYSFLIDIDDIEITRVDLP